MMKPILFTLFFCATTFLCRAQVAKDSISISVVVNLDQKVDFENYQVKFKRVITDSRCPKSVMCVRAGEAEVLVSIYKNGNFIVDKKIKIDASGYVIASNNLAFDAENFKIYGYSLTPYPKGVVGIADKDYKLELVFKLKVLD